jgi:tryptophanyl-tRNA synthetase
MTSAHQHVRVLTGIRSTGSLHIGNYLGTVKPALVWQKTHPCLFFIADLHSLTSLRDRTLRVDSCLDLCATWLACGLDTSQSIFFRQSDVPAHTELTWYLSCVTGVGMLEKAHAFKDAVENGLDANMGLFSYPLLMSADILLYDARIVPVGKDQKQHVEMARDFAGSFNAVYGEVLVLPEACIQEDVMIIPGLDGRKMSKSYNNTIPLFCSVDELKRKIFSITTDSTPLEASKAVEGTALGVFYKHFSSEETYKDFSSRMLKGGLGWGHAKQELLDVIDAYISPLRAYYNELRQDVPFLKKTLSDGAERAHEIAASVLQRVRHSMGVASW